MNDAPTQLDPPSLYGVMTALVCGNDGELVDDSACFPCSADTHAFWCATRDSVDAMWSNFDYLASPEFNDSISGKSPQYVEVAKRMASQKSGQHQADFDAALQNAVNSDRIFDLLPASAHSELREILSVISV